MESTRLQVWLFCFFLWSWLCVGSHFTVYLKEWPPLFTCELCTVQAIQRQLEEVAEKQRDLEERGVAVEKSIRREAGAGKPCLQSSLLLQDENQLGFYSLNDLFSSFFFFFHPEAPPVDDIEEAQLYQTWFKLVLEKNRLARYESELMILYVVICVWETENKQTKKLHLLIKQEK